MKTRSLRVRLLAGAAAAIFAALALAWIAMSFMFEAHIERSVEANLENHGRELIAGLTAAPDGTLSTTLEPNDPRFATPASGFYWQINAGAQVLRSRSLWDATLPLNTAVRGEDWASSDLAGPFEARIHLVSRRIEISGVADPLIVTLAEDHAAVTAARDAFGRDLAIFMIVLWLALSAAAWLQVHLGLQPLEDVRRALATMRAGKRLEADVYPAEAAPLAEAINTYAAAHERDLELAKRRAADLAHSLKTPLAALAAQARRAREAGATDAADGLDRAIAAATAAVERELVRTRAASVEAKPARVRKAVSDLIKVIERTEHGEALVFDNAVEDVETLAPSELIMEIAGPLLENAARHARTRVRVSGDVASLVIEDDGQGMSEADAEAALMRGKRLDESDSGHGLGLAIADELVRGFGGALHLGRSALGGLRVEVRWRV
ncbi:MAG: sensor histidine kinase [Hyphomonadaceae bacterium]|nr:sensor histidine kinase [Hyphomonadaceae bacterium]